MLLSGDERGEWAQLDLMLSGRACEYRCVEYRRDRKNREQRVYGFPQSVAFRAGAAPDYLQSEHDERDRGEIHRVDRAEHRLLLSG